MSTDNVVRLIQPGTFDDQLTAVLRDGAKALLAKAVEPQHRLNFFPLPQWHGSLRPILPALCRAARAGIRSPIGFSRQ